jgi:CDP-glucose 4,6-dehydratase
VEAVVNASTWAGRRVFVTGHTGFKGGWLALWLKRLGAHVSGYALAPEAGGFYELAGVRQALQAQWLADVRDVAALREALAAAQPEVVFHLAAQPLVRASYADPLGTFATNVMGTAHLLDAVRGQPGVRATVVVTTDKCYRDLGPPCREDDALGGHDPYSASKAGAEIVAASYAASFALPVATARAGNVIGGGDISTDRLVPDLLRAVDAGTPLHLRHPHAVRPWQHVMEPVAGYLTLAERLLADPADFGGAWNFGPAELRGQPVRTVAELLLIHAHADGATLPPLSFGDGTGVHEAGVLLLDSSKAAKRLGWRGRLTLDEALRLTWQWHRAHRRAEDLHALTLQQIDSYAVSIA